MAYTLATRRLQGVVGEGDDVVDGRDGVAVVMRYTLRLLTAQQFQRAATLICAAELLRQQRAETDSRYGGVPFRLGMWVGGAVSPNTSRDAARFAVDAKLGGYSGGRATPVQLTDCPWCGHTIDTSAAGRYDTVLQRFLIFCDNVKECSFAEASSNGEGIPVITVDEEIYRLVPSFVIGTIDKFAQLPVERGDCHASSGESIPAVRGMGTVTPISTGPTGRSGRRTTPIGRPANILQPGPYRRSGCVRLT